MLNIKKSIPICLTLILYSCLAFSQKGIITNTYTTYSDELLPKHSLFIENNRVLLKVPSMALFPEKNINFISKIKRDTIYILGVEKDVIHSDGVKLNNDQFVSKLVNTRFYIKSKDVIIHLETNRPYFNNSSVDSLLGNQIIYAVNGKILKSEKDSIALKDILNQEKFEIIELKKLQGEDAITSYGILGLHNIIEINGRYKNCP